VVPDPLTMGAHYLVRFDDICPTMAWPAWERIEQRITVRGIRPIVAIVPDNADDKLVMGPANPSFWDRARAWQAAGWAIGLHGYRHRYETDEAGIVGLQPKSEFAGVEAGEQRRRIAAGLSRLRSEGLEPTVWVAPSHSFDEATVDALVAEGLTTISDGLRLRPHRDGRQVTWVPQQIWRFRPRPFGVWTVCLHHNRWSDGDVDDFLAACDRYRSQIVDLSWAVDRARVTRGGPMTPATWRAALRLKQHMAGALGR